MIGDKVDDLLAGKGAKINTTILVRTGKEITPEGESAADYVLDSIEDLPRLISRQKI